MAVVPPANDDDVIVVVNVMWHRKRRPGESSLWSVVGWWSWSSAPM